VWNKSIQNLRIINSFYQNSKFPFHKKLKTCLDKNNSGIHFFVKWLLIKEVKFGFEFIFSKKQLVKNKLEEKKIIK